MNNIDHKDIFELLAIDLDMPELQVKELLLKKGTSEFIHFLKQKDLWIHKTELLLSSEILDPNGKILINKGIAINKYLMSLMDKYVKDDHFKTSSFSLQCTEEMLNMYRSRSMDKMNSIMNNYIYTQDTYDSLFTNFPNVKTDYNNMLGQIVANPKGVCTLLKFLGGFHGHADTVINSINSSLITIALSSCGYAKTTEANRVLSAKAGTASLLQYIKTIAGSCFCESTSAEIIKSMVNDETLEQAILMSSNADYDSAPIFSDSVNRTNYYLRVMVTVSLFVDLVHQNKTDTQNLEVHKALYELAEMGYADKEITILLGKLFLPEAKYLILEHAYNIKNMCTNCPVIWSSVGDMLPVKFLCLKESCQNSGGHKTLIPKDVNIDVSGTYKTCIAAGVYYTCNFLTNNLQDYYKSVVRNKEN